MTIHDKVELRATGVDSLSYADGHKSICVTLALPPELERLSSKDFENFFRELLEENNNMFTFPTTFSPVTEAKSDNVGTKENVDHPLHYGGKDNPYEAIKVIEAWLGIEGLKGFCLGNALKYTSRAGKKDGNSEQQDRDKAIWYIDYYNNRVKELSEKKS